MAAAQPSRQSDRGGVQTALLARENPLSGAGALSIRLWRIKEGAEPSELPWEGNDPAVCVALDVISASEGFVAAARGLLLTATFPGIQAAILAARRLQWAYQGLSDGSRPAGTAVAVLVHCTENPPGQGVELTELDHAALDAVGKAAPGQILLTAKAAEILRDLPGLPMQVATEALLSELLWNVPAEKTSRSSDEETLSEFIKQNGLEDKAPALVQAAAVTVEPGKFSSATGQARVDSDAGEASESRRISPRIFIGAGCGVAALLAIAALLVFSHNRQPKPAPVAVQQAAPAAVGATPTVQQPQTQPSTPPPVLATAAPAAPAAPAKAAPTTQENRTQEETAHGKPAFSVAGKSRASANPALPAGCDLESSMIPKRLDQAERSRAQGDYAAARRQFRSVLACEPNNARAVSGVRQTELDMQHQ